MLAAAEAETALAGIVAARGDVDGACALLLAAVPVLRRGHKAGDLRRADAVRQRLRAVDAPAVRELEDALRVG